MEKRKRKKESWKASKRKSASLSKEKENENALLSTLYKWEKGCLRKEGCFHIKYIKKLALLKQIPHFSIIFFLCNSHIPSKATLDHNPNSLTFDEIIIK